MYLYILKYANSLTNSKICAHDKAVFWGSFEKGKYVIGSKIEKSAKNPTGIFVFFYVSAYSGIFIQPR